MWLENVDISLPLVQSRPVTGLGNFADMKAVVYNNYGAPDVLHVSKTEKPQPKEHEILVRIIAAEVTKADCEMRSFNFPVKWFWLPLRLVMGITKPRRHVLGNYFAGVIEEIEANVTKFKVGDEIYGGTGFRFGAHGEYVNLSEDASVAPKPENIGFESAASIPLGGLNALHFMRLANIQNGTSILINGAGGSIGLLAMQIAKDMGAEVSVVDSGTKEKMLRGIGVIDFYNYTKENFANSGNEYDVVFDMVAQSSFSDCIKVLKPKGMYITGNPTVAKMFRCAFLNRFSDKSATFKFANETIEELLTLKSMIEDGRISPIVDKVLPMENAAEAHHLVETEQRMGSIVLSISNQ